MYDICVIGGAGHVGLPISIAFADKGKKVIIYDKNQEHLNKINDSIMPFREQGAEPLLKKVINKTLFTTNSMGAISDAKFIIIIIGTPVDKHLNPSFHNLISFVDEILSYFRNEQIIILRSTLYPGTTKKIQSMAKKKNPTIEVCFCPERISEGNALKELYILPQIVSGFSDDAVAQVRKLFKLITCNVIVTDPIEAELAKLFTNSWRYIQFSIANQFYMIAQEYGVDFYRIYKAMTFDYPRAKNFPTPGFTAGPCLFKDTMQLSAFTNNKFFLGHSAMLINEGLPNFLVDQLKERYDLTKKTVGVLGMSFKAESDDKRDSLSYKLKKILEIEAKEVICSDVYIKDDQFVDEEILIDKSDIIIIGAPHKKYKTLDYKNKILVDVWNHIENEEGVK